MVAKTKTKGEELQTRRLKLGKLKLNKDTVKDLTATEKPTKRGCWCENERTQNNLYIQCQWVRLGPSWSSRQRVDIVAKGA